MTIGTVLGAALAYLLGLVSHELTHVLVCRRLGVPVTSLSVGWNRVTVHYAAETHRESHWVRIAPLLVFPLLVVVGGVWLALGPSLERGLYLFGFLMGYLPRSRSDWTPVRAVLGDSF